MADSATPLGKLRDQESGANPTQWGTIQDANNNRLEEWRASILEVDAAGSGNITLTDTDYVANQYRRAAWEFTGARSANGEIIVPSRSGWAWAKNSTTGGYTLTVKTSAGTGIDLTATGDESGWRALYCDGTDVLDFGLINAAQLVVELAAVTGAGFSDTSTTSNSIPSVGESRTFTTASSGKAIAKGTPLRIASTAAPATDYWDGIATSYSGSTLTAYCTATAGSGTIADWTISVAGGPVANTLPYWTYVTKTSTFTLDASYLWNFVDVTSGSFTIDLTAAATVGEGFRCLIANTGSGSVVIDPASSEVIKDATSNALSTITLEQFEAVGLMSDGSNWHVVEDRRGTTGAGSSAAVVTTSGATNVAATDKGKVYLINGDHTLSIAALSGWTDGDYFEVRSIVARTSGSVGTLDPDSSETIDGRTTIKIYPGEGFKVVKYGSGWITVGRSKGMVFLHEVVNGGAVASVNFQKSGAYFDDTELTAFRLLISGVSGSASAQPTLRVYDGGSYQSDASDYEWGYLTAFGTPAGATDDADSEIHLGPTVSNAADPNSYDVDIFQADGTDAHYPMIKWMGIHSGNSHPHFGVASYQANGRIEGMQFLWSTGNVDDGTFRLFGLRM